MKKCILLLFCAFAFFSCSKNSSQKNSEKIEEEKKESSEIQVESKSEIAEESANSIEKKEKPLNKNEAVKEFVESMNEEERIAQLFLVNVEGSEKYVSVEKRSDGKPLVPGGALLFSFNIASSPADVFAYTESIRAFSRDNSLVPPFVSVDQEGGDVNRLRGITSVLWSQKKVAERFSLEGAEKLYSSQAFQLKNLGIDMNLAPVVEAENPKNAEFLETRTFGKIEDVLNYGEIEIDSFEKNGVLTCLKHFPGNSATDPHIGLPKIELSKEDLPDFLKTFENLSKKSSAVLMSHAIAQIEGESGTEIPACFSKFWIENLRKMAGKNCLVVSDDVFMAALSENGYPPETAAISALRAGVDCVMLSEKRFFSEVRRVLEESKKDEIFLQRIKEACENVILFKLKCGIFDFDEKSGAIVPGKSRNFNSAEFESAKNAGIEIYSTGGKK